MSKFCIYEFVAAIPVNVLRLLLPLQVFENFMLLDIRFVFNFLLGD